MKLLYDVFPALIFFIAYKLFGIYVATAVLIVASAVQVAYLWLRYRRLEPMHWLVFVLVLVFGGATLWFHDAKFLEWKVSIVNGLFGLAFLASQWFTRKPLIQRLLDTSIQLPTRVWARLNTAWGLFFIAMAVLNLYIAHRYSLAVWVDFKVFGVLGLTVVFVIAQSFYLYRHMDHKHE